MRCLEFGSPTMSEGFQTYTYPKFQAKHPQIVGVGRTRSRKQLAGTDRVITILWDFRRKQRFGCDPLTGQAGRAQAPVKWEDSKRAMVKQSSTVMSERRALVNSFGN